MSGNIRILFVIALAVVATFNTGCKTGSHSSVDGSPSQTSVSSTIPRPVAPRLVCPPLGSVLVPAPQLKGGHRVILKWRASRRGDAKHADAVGYCIYRGPGRDAPPTELINHLPFTETKCADDSVGNGKQYYYVVRAISARGVPSEVSKPPAPARIPTTPRASSPTPEDLIPLCRESPGVKSP
jgi:hypothetical protein